MKKIQKTNNSNSATFVDLDFRFIFNDMIEKSALSEEFNSYESKMVSGRIENFKQNLNISSNFEIRKILNDMIEKPGNENIKIAFNQNNKYLNLGVNDSTKFSFDRSFFDVKDILNESKITDKNSLKTSTQEQKNETILNFIDVINNKKEFYMFLDLIVKEQEKELLEKLYIVADKANIKYIKKGDPSYKYELHSFDRDKNLKDLKDKFLTSVKNKLSLDIENLFKNNIININSDEVKSILKNISLINPKNVSIVKLLRLIPKSKITKIERSERFPEYKFNFPEESFEFLDLEITL